MSNIGSRALCPWGTGGDWKTFQKLPGSYRSSEARGRGKKWNSLDFLLDHARRERQDGVGPSTNPYLQEFASSTWVNKLRHPAFKNMVNNKKLKKEVREAYAAIRQIRRFIRHKRARSKPLKDKGEVACTAKSIDAQNLLIFDLCSGKGFTASIMTHVFPNAKILMIDKDCKMKLTHLSILPKVKFKYADVHSDCLAQWIARSALNEKKNSAANDTKAENYPCPEWNKLVVVLLGIHLCGTLSTTAVRLFNEIVEIDCMVLCPCCMPRKNRDDCDVRARARALGKEPYEVWCWSVYNHIDHRTNLVDLSRDPFVASHKKSGAAHAKNIFIRATRRSQQNVETGKPVAKIKI
ncbi:hypothetical protein AAMO2058_001514300 [Amorphochlora amoebiformis]